MQTYVNAYEVRFATQTFWEGRNVTGTNGLYHMG